jgi:PST family polysaccharide transporter
VYVLTIGRFGITVAVTFVVAAFVDPRSYGVMALAMVWVYLAQMVSLQGFTLAIVQREHVEDRHFSAAFWANIAIAAVEAILFVALAPVWASTNDASDLIAVSWALTPVILINAAMATPEAMLRRGMRFKELSRRVLTAGMISAAVAVGAAVAGLGVWALVVQQLSLAVGSMVAVWSLTKWRPSFSGVGSALRDLRRFSTQSFVSSVGGFVSDRIDALLMGAFFGPVAVGLYRFAGRIPDMVTSVSSGGLGQFSFPYLSRHGGDRDRFVAQLTRLTHLVAILNIPLLGVVAAAGPSVLRLLGPDWEPATGAFLILCATCIPSAYATVLAPAILAAGRPDLDAKLSWAKAIVSVAVLLVVGRAEAGREPGVQVVALAIAIAIIHVVYVLAMLVFGGQRIIGASLARMLLPGLPALASGGAAFVSVWLITPWLDTLPRLLAVVVAGCVASAVAGALILFDPEVRRFAMVARGRLRRTAPASVEAAVEATP